MGGERAVLAVAAARTRQGEGEVAREGDAAAHPGQVYACPPIVPADAPGAHRPRRGAGVRARGPSLRGRGGGPGADRDARPRLHAERRPRGHLLDAGARLRPGGRGPARRRAAVVVDRLGQAPARRAGRLRRARHPRPGHRARGRTRRRRRPGARRSGRSPRSWPSPAIRTPRDLAGRQAGVTGLPSDDAVLRSVVAGAGGDPRRVREVTIGFDAVPALLGGARRGGHRLLGRRGRRARAPAAGLPRRSGSTTTGRRPIRSSSSA